MVRINELLNPIASGNNTHADHHLQSSPQSKSLRTAHAALPPSPTLPCICVSVQKLHGYFKMTDSLGTGRARRVGRGMLNITNGIHTDADTTEAVSTVKKHLITQLTAEHRK